MDSNRSGLLRGLRHLGECLGMRTDGSTHRGIVRRRQLEARVSFHSVFAHIETLDLFFLADSKTHRGLDESPENNGHDKSEQDNGTGPHELSPEQCESTA